MSKITWKKILLWVGIGFGASTTIGLAEQSGENDYAFTTGMLMIPTLGETFSPTGATFDSSEGDEIAVDVWQGSDGKWHIRNAVPYSQIERKATRLYNDLHDIETNDMAIPLLIAPTEEAAEAVSNLLGGCNKDEVVEKLDFLEQVLTSNDLIN